MGEQMSDWTKDEGWMCGWISGFMDGWMDGWMNTYTVLKYSLDSASVLIFDPVYVSPHLMRYT